MGWRDAQAKVDAGAYKPKADPFGEFATGFANVFVPTYTKIQEEKRAEERKKREEEAKKAAAAAAAARAEDKKERERQSQTDFILLQLGFSDPSEASDNIRQQVYAGVVNVGPASTADMLLKRYPQGLPDSAYATNKAPDPVVTPAEEQTDDILSTDTTPGSVGTNVTTEPLDKQTRDNLAAVPEDSALKPSATVEPATEAVTPAGNTDAQSISLFGPQPRKIDLNEFIGKDSTFINDWIKINGAKYDASELSKLQDYSSEVQERESNDVWWKDPSKLKGMDAGDIRYELSIAPEGSEKRKTLEEVLKFKVEGVKLDSLISADLEEFKRFRIIHGEQMQEQGILSTFEELEELAEIKAKDELWWKDPRQVDDLSNTGLDYAISSATDPDEKAALQEAKKSRVEGLDLDSMRGKSVIEFDQFEEQYGDRLDSEGLRGKFDRMRSLQKSIEDQNASEKSLNAKDLFLRNRMETDEYEKQTSQKQSQLLLQYEREWAEGTRVASNETYTQANYDADYIKYSEIIKEVGLGNGAQYSDAEIAEARRWMTVTKPIAEERLNAGSTRSIDNKINMLVNDLGVDREMAKKIALGVIDVRVDPVTREAFTFDISTGQRIGSVANPQSPVVTPEQSGQEEEPGLTVIPEEEIEALFTEYDGLAARIANIDVSKPMGLVGALRRTANTASAFVGLPKPSKDTSEAQGVLGMLSVLTETTLAAALPENRDSVYLKKRLQTLSPKYGVNKTVEDVRDDTANMIAFLNDNLEDMRNIASGKAGVQPADVSKARVGIPRIEKLLGYYEALASVVQEQTVQPSGADYLGNAIPEPPATNQDTPAPEQGTEANPYITTATTDPASIPSGAYYRDPNGVLRQKQ